MPSNVHFAVIRPTTDDAGAVVVAGGYHGTRHPNEKVATAPDDPTSYDHQIVDGVRVHQLNAAVEQGNIEVSLAGGRVRAYAMSIADPTRAR